MTEQTTSLARKVVTATLTVGACLGAYVPGCTVTGVEYQILIDREFAMRAMLETATFRSGEKFRLRIAPQQDCRAYLLNHGSSGEYALLFPIPQIKGGSKRLVLCVSQRSHRRLEELAKSGFSDTAATEALLVQLEQENRRASSFVKTIDDDGTRACLVARDPDAVLVCRMTLRHESRESMRTPADAPPADATALVSLEDAIRRNMVRLTATGSGLSSVRVHLVRLRQSGPRVSIPAGTYFANRSGAQNMIGARTVTLDLTTQETASLEVPSVCADFDRREPDAQTRFTLSSISDARLRRLMQVIDRRRSSHVVAQVAVWAVTNDVSREQLDRTFRRTQLIGGAQVGAGPAATDADIAAAKSLLDEAGLETESLRLFH